MNLIVTTNWKVKTDQQIEQKMTKEQLINMPKVTMHQSSIGHKTKLEKNQPQHDSH